MVAHLRFYADLNAYLPMSLQNHEVTLNVFPTAPLAAALESLGIPLGEVDLILVNGDSQPPTYVLQGEDVVEVYPLFEERGSEPSPHLRSKKPADKYLAG
ncbi:hypothetical protein [Bdellovibrio sp. HCB209]|uniref:hypothetical protein n=1 Tax=Bdellovibrio sp. HCB209 TaxID=3394354 RepID=UPI0039B6C6C8